MHLLVKCGEVPEYLDVRVNKKLPSLEVRKQLWPTARRRFWKVCGDRRANGLKKPTEATSKLVVSVFSLRSAADEVFILSLHDFL
jgi:hypothetical protein